MTERIEHHLVVPQHGHHQRLDQVLRDLLPDYSRSQLCEWIKSGSVKLNQQDCRPKDKVSLGDRIDIQMDCSSKMPLLEAEAIPLTIVFEDDDVLIVNKPAGLVVHPGAGNPQHTLVNALLHHAPSLSKLSRAGIIHRLDKDTTGLLMVAKTLTAHSALIRQMQARTIKRHYLTLVQGQLIAGGIIETGFGRHPSNRLKMCVTGPRQAITHYKIKKRYSSYTLLDVQLMTGRTHQIRVHLSHIKHPVVGDPLYGGRMIHPKGLDAEFIETLQAFKRQALHATTLSFIHPKSKEVCHFTAPLPHDFQHLLNLLETYDEL